MFWLQAGFSFVLWVGFGALVATRREMLEPFIVGFGRIQKVLIAAGLMILCLAFLFGPLLLLLKSGHFAGGAMSAIVWLVVTASGLFFVGANTVAMAFLVTLVKEAAVTGQQAAASSKEDFHS